MPALAPITWNAEGLAVLEVVDGKWGASYPYPDVPKPPRNIAPRTGIDRFQGTTLSHDWEWNHNPDNSKWSLDEGLKLSTATVTTDLYKARNTLTRRILGPASTATIELDVAAMKDGDRAGLALLRNSSAWIGVKKSGSATSLVMVNGLTDGQLLEHDQHQFRRPRRRRCPARRSGCASPRTSDPEPTARASFLTAPTAPRSRRSVPISR